MRVRPNAVRQSALLFELPGGIHGRIRRSDLLRGQSGMPFAALVGEEIEGLVIAIEPGERGLLVSPRHLAARRFGRIAGRRRRVQGRVLYANGGGLVVDLGGRITGFVPRSELLPEHSAQHADLAGERWRGYVLEATRRSIVLTVSEPESTSRAGAIVSASIAKGAAPFRLAG